MQLPLISQCLLAAVIAACGNRTGNLATSRYGDVSNPVERRSPIEDLVRACGAATDLPGGRAVIRRQAYLQQVTTSSAMIGWVTTTRDPQVVTITTPDGAVVTEVAAVPEATIVRRRDEQQMWATVDGLDPDTIYCYEIAVAGELISSRSGLRTAPTADSTRPIQFLAFGDSGYGGSDQLALFRQMSTVPFELMVHVGDIAYDSGTIGELEDHVFAIYAPLLRHIPLFPVAGNHEYDTDDARPFRAVFALPNNERWYSYDWGPIHFAAIDTEQDLAEQARWLDRDLATTALPWKIVFLHRPPYSSGKHGSDTDLREALSPIFEKHRIQLVLAGHDHHYERTHPRNGVTYVVTGGGGRGTRRVCPSSFTAFSSEVIHFVLIEVEPDKLTLHAIDGMGTEFDSLIVPRQGSRLQRPAAHHVHQGAERTNPHVALFCGARKELPDPSARRDPRC